MARVLVCLLGMLPGMLKAQSITQTAASFAAPASEATITPIPTLLTSFIHPHAHNITATSLPSSNPDYTTPPSDGSNDDDDNDPQSTDEAFNYYFLFLIIVGIVMTAFLLWMHARRKRRRAQLRLSGQNALAQDIDGWQQTRRWFYGTQRPAGAIMRQNGLNEHGEAPPPYQPKNEVTVTMQAHGLEDDHSRPAIPLRTLPRDDAERSNPPAYGEDAGGQNGRASGR